MHPILLELPFGLRVYAYGFMLCVSVIAGRELAVRLARREGMDGALTRRAAIWAVVGAIIVARLLYVATNPDQFHSLLDVVSVWKGGVVAYGGFLGGFIGTLAFCRLHRLRVLPWVDCVAPALCIGLLFTRLGCFLAGCDFGQPWDGPLAVEFPAGSIAHKQQVMQGLLPATATASLPVHPTQLYESFAGAALFGGVMFVRSRRGFFGQPFLVFVAGYGVLRAVIEVFRADVDRGAVGILSTSQFIAAATIVAAIAATVVLRRRSARPGGSVSYIA